MQQRDKKGNCQNLTHVSDHQVSDHLSSPFMVSFKVYVCEGLYAYYTTRQYSTQQLNILPLWPQAGTRTIGLTSQPRGNKSLVHDVHIPEQR